MKNVSETATKLKVSAPTIRKLINEGMIPYIKIGGRYLIPVKHLNKWINDKIFYPGKKIK